jgi:outer membrane protein OmpA-like peptidoglycan-associated protein
MFIKTRRNTAATHEQVEESGYMASASDLMIGLLFIFIVMVMVLLSRKPEPPETPADPLATVVHTIGTKLQNAGVPVTINQVSGVISLPADTLFARGSADLENLGVRTLRQSTEQLQRVLPCYIYSQRRNLPSDCPPNPQQVEIETILIEGHTDSVPLQRGDYNNWHLGLDRARAVYKVLGSEGMQSFRNERDQPVFGISSYADERPSSKNNEAQNRRVELRFVLAFQPTESGATKAPSSTLKKMQETVR